jgi:tungstate transport system substrate-binding protein
MLTPVSRRRLICLALAAVCAFGCVRAEQQPTERITLATTTSMQDSGMLDLLLPAFKEQTGIGVQVIAVGSGQAMELGRRGDADVLITHSPAAEQQFVDEGYGIERREIMFNDFILVGPADDPAKVASAGSAVDAFRRMADARHTFLSRGDDSGTHVKELRIWEQADVDLTGDWYLKGGVGMAQALRMANEKHAYTLSDRGTYLALCDELQLKVLFEGDPILENRYSVTVINPEKHPQAKVEAARAFAEFLRSPATRERISQFGVDRFGQPLFKPAE